MKFLRSKGNLFIDSTYFWLVRRCENEVLLTLMGGTRTLIHGGNTTNPQEILFLKAFVHEILYHDLWFCQEILFILLLLRLAKLSMQYLYLQKIKVLLFCTILRNLPYLLILEFLEFSSNKCVQEVYLQMSKL